MGIDIPHFPSHRAWRFRHVSCYDLAIALLFGLDLPLRVQLSAIFPKNLEARRDGNRGTSFVERLETNL